MWKSMIYKLFFLCFLPLFLCFLSAEPAKAVNSSFEQYEGFPAEGGDIYGINNWYTGQVFLENHIGLASTTNDVQYTGYQSAMPIMDKTVVLWQEIASSTQGTQCVRAYAQDILGHDDIGLMMLYGNNTANYVGRIQLDNPSGLIKYATQFGVYADTAENYVGAWNTLCITYDCASDEVSYRINDTYIGTASTTFTCDYVDVVYSSYQHDSVYKYWDTYNSDYTTPYGGIDQSGKLVWFYPQDGYVENCGTPSTGNPDANWGLIYDLNPEDIGKWNIIIVYYTDSAGVTYNDYDIIAPNDDQTYWTHPRTSILPAGETYAYGLISRIDECENYNDEDCVWGDVASTSIITFDVSTASTCKDVMDYGLTGFTPASTTASSTEEAGWVGQTFNRIKNVFPLSIMFQIQALINSITASSSQQTALNIPLNSILPEVMASQIATSVVMFNANTMTDYFSFWGDTIFPSFEKLIYLGFFVLVIFILWPRAKQATE